MKVTLSNLEFLGIYNMTRPISQSIHLVIQYILPNELVSMIDAIQSLTVLMTPNCPKDTWVLHSKL